MKKTDKRTPSSSDDQVLNDLENESEPKDHRVKYIEDPENPPLICFADVLGWVLGFFFLFAVWAIGYTIWSTVSGAGSLLLGDVSNLDSKATQENEANNQRLDALEKRLEDSSAGSASRASNEGRRFESEAFEGGDTGGEDLQHQEGQDLDVVAEARPIEPVAEPRPSKADDNSFMRKLRKTISKDADRSRDEAHGRAGRSGQ